MMALSLGCNIQCQIKCLYVIRDDFSSLQYGDMKKTNCLLMKPTEEKKAHIKRPNWHLNVRTYRTVDILQDSLFTPGNKNWQINEENVIAKTPTL